VSWVDFAFHPLLFNLSNKVLHSLYSYIDAFYSTLRYLSLIQLSSTSYKPLNYYSLQERLTYSYYSTPTQPTTMKFIVLAAAAVIAGAAAAPAAEPEPWCMRSGMPCWKTKREASPWCMRPGMPCWKVKRTTDAFADAITDDSSIQARSHIYDYPFGPGSPAFYANGAIDELASLAALSSSDAVAYYGSLNLPSDFDVAAENDTGALNKRWCMRPGMPCWKRSAGDDESDNHTEEKRRCMRPGMPCWKRSTEELNTEDKRWCMRPGMPCWKAKRAAEAILEASNDATDAENSADGLGECDRPGQPCWKAKRDIYALRSVARTVADAF
jgi:hypothetical protein